MADSKRKVAKSEVASMDVGSGSKGGEEREVQSRTFDGEKVGATVKKLNDEIATRKAAEAKAEADLMTTPVDAADVALVQRELDLTTEKAAARLLKQHKGDVTATLRSYVA